MQLYMLFDVKYKLRKHLEVMTGTCLYIYGNFNLEQQINIVLYIIALQTEEAGGEVSGVVAYYKWLLSICCNWPPLLIPIQQSCTENNAQLVNNIKTQGGSKRTSFE